MHMDPAMPQLMGVLLLLLFTGMLLKVLKQPHVIAYLIAGIFIGPFGIELITDTEAITRFGAMGVVLLLFFVGMETDPKKLASNWRLAIIGTLVQIALSILFVYLLAFWFDWSIQRTILIGFVISLSSTAVVIKLLQDTGIIHTRAGQSALSIVLAQDLAIVPMLILLGLLGENSLEPIHLIKQGVGSFVIVLLLMYVFKKPKLELPFSRWFKHDHELQLFAALVICFGLAFITAWFELSTALGAFIAGIIIGVAKETQWVQHALEPFKVLFLALFFVSVGMLLNIDFLLTNLVETLALVIAVILTNTFINALILKFAKFNWKDSLYTGVLLSQVGEFSFVLAAVGFQSSIINEYGYQLALCVISVSLLVSPAWIAFGRSVIGWNEKD
ncbi:cation:proton antiporter [Aliikangiella marina]|uniref:Cation:proton antiporter n=1 Tax=Aliikangiella marina TaxID=1712262 RepID=A0A545TEA6_9GAMM|nr:cation:proton antiporter [Aliikangiella marina]TQV75554.1 cation:proton antiporter [Aliikangiella marina]